MVSEDGANHCPSNGNDLVSLWLTGSDKRNWDSAWQPGTNECFGQPCARVRVLYKASTPAFSLRRSFFLLVLATLSLAALAQERLNTAPQPAQPDAAQPQAETRFANVRSRSAFSEWCLFLP